MLLGLIITGCVVKFCFDHLLAADLGLRTHQMKLDLSMLEPSGGPSREPCGLASVGGADALQADCFPLPAVTDVSGKGQS